MLAIPSIIALRLMRSLMGKQFLHCFQRRLSEDCSRSKVDQGTVHQLQSDVGIPNGDSIMNGVPILGLKEKTSDLH
jgi:hypothetical protein